MMKTALKYTGSPWTVAGITLTLTCVYIAMSFGGPSWHEFMEFIFSSAVGLVLYLSLALSLTAWSALAVLKRQPPLVISAEDVRLMDEHIHMGSAPEMKTLGDVSAWDKTKGFSKVSHIEGGIVGTRGSLSILPGIVLRAGVALLMLAVLASWHGRVSQDIVITEGGIAEVMGMKVEAISIDAAIPDEFLSVGTVGFVLDDIRLKLKSGEGEFEMGGSYPVKSGGVYWRLADLGYAQPVSLEGGGSNVIMLKLLPPGSVDTARLSPEGETYEFRLSPAKKVRKGLLSGDLFKLKTPSYSISKRGKKDTAVVAKAGQAFEIGKDRGEFGEAGMFVRLEAVRDPALPVVKAGLFLMALGSLLMLLRLFWYERRFMAVMHEGTPLVGYSEEFYSKWAVYKSRLWFEALRTR